MEEKLFQAIKKKDLPSPCTPCVTLACAQDLAPTAWVEAGAIAWQRQEYIVICQQWPL